MVFHSAADEKSEETTLPQQRHRQPQAMPPPSQQPQRRPRSMAAPKATVRSQHERPQSMVRLMAVKSPHQKPQSSAPLETAKLLQKPRLSMASPATVKSQQPRQSIAPVTVKSQTQPQNQKQVHSRPLHNFSFPDTKWSMSRGGNHLHHSPGGSRLGRSSHSPPKEAIAENKEKAEKTEEKKPAVVVASEEDDGGSKLVIRIRIRSKEVAEAAGDRVMAVKEKFEEAEVEEEDDDDDDSDDDEDEEVAFEEHVEPKTWELRPRSGRIAGPGHEFEGPKKEKKPNLRISLTKREIETDFIAMTGAKPPKKPNKRPKNIEKTIDTILPGLRVSTVTPNRYIVEDSLPPKI